MTSQPLDGALRHARARGELGVQISAWRDGEPVAELSSGDPLALYPIFSVSKAVVATALHLQAERGRVSYGARVSEYWPEYAQNGKDETTVRDVLTHRAGVPQVPAGVTIERMGDWDWMVAQLAEAAPLFPPGTISAYHSLTWGWLVGEIVRRSDGSRRSLSRFIAEEISAPLGIEHLHLGVPPHLRPRVAVLRSDEPATAETDPLRLAVKPPQVALTAAIYNDPAVLAGVHPGTGMVADARSVARLFAMLAGGGSLGGVRLLSPQRVRSFLQPRRSSGEVDRVQGRPARIGIGGYWLSGGSASDDAVTGGGPAVLYHPGQGGSLAWADLDTRVSVAICHNRMFDLRIDPAVHPFAGLGAAVAAL